MLPSLDILAFISASSKTILELIILIRSILILGHIHCLQTSITYLRNKLSQIDAQLDTIRNTIEDDHQGRPCDAPISKHPSVKTDDNPSISEIEDQRDKKRGHETSGHNANDDEAAKERLAYARKLVAPMCWHWHMSPVPEDEGVGME